MKSRWSGLGNVIDVWLSYSNLPVGDVWLSCSNLPTGVMSTLFRRVFDRSYLAKLCYRIRHRFHSGLRLVAVGLQYHRPPIGLAAARIEARALSVA